MTIKLLLGDEIRSHVLKILSGECVFIRKPQRPILYVLSPWISDVVIDFSDRYISKELTEYATGEKNESFLLQDYNIKSINLSYALLLFKLHGACAYYQKAPEVNIVTLPPNEKNYSREYLPKLKNFLNFLDEIGCQVFLNSSLHSKVLMTNDLALLGSFNLSSSALLYNREEIGVSVNDLDNLEALEAYCRKVMHGSERFGYSSLLDYGRSPNKGEKGQIWTMAELINDAREKLSPEKERWARMVKGAMRQTAGIYKKKEVSLSEIGITRGWILDSLVDEVYFDRGGYGEFLNITGGYDKLISSYAKDLNLFYLTNIRKLVTYEDAGVFMRSNFDYFGDNSTDSIFNFIVSKFARPVMPFIRLQMQSLEARS